MVRRVHITHADCPRMRERYKGTSDFLRVSSMDAVREMMEWGAEHVERMDAEGQLEPLDDFRLQAE